MNFRVGGPMVGTILSKPDSIRVPSTLPASTAFPSTYPALWTPCGTGNMPRRLMLLRSRLISCLGVLDRAGKFGQASWVYVADSERFEIVRAEGHHVKS